jgi:hypothetical protein
LSAATNVENDSGLNHFLLWTLFAELFNAIFDSDGKYKHV